VGLTKKEKNLPSKKDAIDKTSEDKQRFRDYYQYSPVDVSQFNRDIANPNRLKNGEVEPMLEDFKDTGSTQENADVVFSLFDPHRYKVEDPSGYEIDKLRDSEGAKYYRQLKILKNSYGSDDVRIGLAFEPHVGHFKEMPKVSQCTDRTYQEVIERGYFMGRDSILQLKRLTQ
jgi:replicative DNA helicase